MLFLLFLHMFMSVNLIECISCVNILIIRLFTILTRIFYTYRCCWFCCCYLFISNKPILFNRHMCVKSAHLHLKSAFYFHLLRSFICFINTLFLIILVHPLCLTHMCVHQIYSFSRNKRYFITSVEMECPVKERSSTDTQNIA